MPSTFFTFNLKPTRMCAGVDIYAGGTTACRLRSQFTSTCKLGGPAGAATQGGLTFGRFITCWPGRCLSSAAAFATSPWGVVQERLLLVKSSLGKSRAEAADQHLIARTAPLRLVSSAFLHAPPKRRRHVSRDVLPRRKEVSAEPAGAWSRGPWTQTYVAQ
jgi:hypothetical protein